MLRCGSLKRQGSKVPHCGTWTSSQIWLEKGKGGGGGRGGNDHVKFKQIGRHKVGKLFARCGKGRGSCPMDVVGDGAERRDSGGSIGEE